MSLAKLRLQTFNQICYTLTRALCAPLCQIRTETTSQAKGAGKTQIYRSTADFTGTHDIHQKIKTTYTFDTNRAIVPAIEPIPEKVFYLGMRATWVDTTG